MYDITRHETLKSLHEWIHLFKDNNSERPDAPILLVGGKSDLEDFRAVPLEEARELAAEEGFSEVIECSSKTGQNVEKVFERIAEKILETDLDAQNQLANVKLDE